MDTHRAHIMNNTPLQHDSSSASLSSIFGGKTKFKSIFTINNNNNNNNNIDTFPSPPATSGRDKHEITVVQDNDNNNNNNNDNRVDNDTSASNIPILNNLNPLNLHHTHNPLPSKHTNSTENIHPAEMIQNKLQHKYLYHNKNSTNSHNNSTSNNNNNDNNIINKTFHHRLVPPSRSASINIADTNNELPLNYPIKMGLHLLRKIGNTTTDIIVNNNTNNNSNNSNNNGNDNNKVYGADSTSNRFLDKYIITDRKIGEGASGTVSIIHDKYNRDKLYAMKVFHTLDNNNTIFDEDNYENHLKKIILEYSIGSILHQQNLIETIDLLIDVSSHTSIIILEYVPYDFFNLVMSNQMTVDESACYFKQLCNAIHYLHKMGISHRDLKLDNCVVTKDGILKLLDFGSAVIFQSPHSINSSTNNSIFSDDDNIIKCTGIVGSDPYLAPELLDRNYRQYDPRPVDVWSIAIIYYCMIMRKFPWKAPRESFNSFRLFCEDPDDEGDVSKGPQRLLRALPSESRTVIGQMMQLNHRKRISIDKVVQDRWLQSIDHCRFKNDNDPTSLMKSNGHVHHLVTEDELNRQLKEQERNKNNNVHSQADSSTTNPQHTHSHHHHSHRNHNVHAECNQNDASQTCSHSSTRQLSL